MLEELIGLHPAEGEILNVNFPGCKLAECKGILRNRKVSRGMFYRDHYNVQAQLPNGGLRLMVEGDYNEDAEPDTDFRAVVENFVSIGIAANIQ